MPTLERERSRWKRGRDQEIAKAENKQNENRLRSELDVCSPTAKSTGERQREQSSRHELRAGDVPSDRDAVRAGVSL